MFFKVFVFDGDDGIVKNLGEIIELSNLSMLQRKEGVRASNIVIKHRVRNWAIMPQVVKLRKIQRVNGCESHQCSRSDCQDETKERPPANPNLYPDTPCSWQLSMRVSHRADAIIQMERSILSWHGLRMPDSLFALLV